MCGIVGVVDFSGARPDPETLQGAAALLARRGPDDAGWWGDECTGLAHRRLSILDTTAAGHQPMLSHDQRYVVVYNGEIYNFAALRDEIGADWPWCGHSDTEVLLAAYQRWGADCVHRFQGMFAFAIWDRQVKSLFAARDRFGVKPFYYAERNGALLFASRPRAIFALQPRLARIIDVQALRFQLEGGYIPAPYSFYRDIRKLGAGCRLFFDNRGLRSEHYWSPGSIATLPHEKPETKLLEELDALVVEAVRARMVSDVPLGVALSGGIDSSLVAAVMTRQSGAVLKSFTIGFAETGFDESSHAAAVAKFLGTDHHVEILRADDLLSLLPEFFREFDEPFFDSSAFPAMALYRLARRHVSVVVGGDGGDEIFGGYHYYRIVRALMPWYRLPLALRVSLSGLGRRLVSHHSMRLLTTAAACQDIVAAFAFMRSIAKDFPAVLDMDIDRQTIGMEALFRNAAGAFSVRLSPVELAMRLDMQHVLPEDYLQKLDLSSMAYSVEAREPLLDHHLAEWGMKLPLACKIRGRSNKYLLRQLAYRYLPREILDRPKQGFVVPIDQWLRTRLKDWAASLLHDRNLFARLPLNQRVLLDLFELHQSGKRNVHPLLWSALMALEYCRREQVGEVGDEDCH
ncbi:MAG: asparagine synthase (glutamine-hydrolyzing) [Pseudomonadota bacterium]